MRIIFIVDGDETPVSSVDWPVAPRVGEIVQFSFGKYPYIDLTVTQVTYMPMLTFIDSEGKHMPDGLLVAVALKPPSVTCDKCGGSGITGDFDLCSTCNGEGKVKA